MLIGPSHAQQTETDVAGIYVSSVPGPLDWRENKGQGQIIYL